MATSSSNTAPGFTVKVGSKEYTQASADGTASLIVEDHVDMVGMAQLSLTGSTLTDAADIKFGDPMEVKLAGGSEVLFTGVVTEVRISWLKAKNTTTIVAMDPLCKLAASRNTKVHSNPDSKQSDSDVASSVISAAGLTAGTVDSTSGTPDYTLQRNESDLFFLKRLAARNGYLLCATPDGKVDFKKTQFQGGTTVELDLNNMEAVEYAMNTLNLPAEGVKVYGWDPVAKETVSGEASASAVTAIGSGEAPTSGDLWKGASVISDVMVTSQSAAQAVAESELNRVSRSFLRGRVTGPGNGSWRAGILVKFTGFASGLNPEGFVVSSRHTIGADGFKSELHFVGNRAPGDSTGAAGAGRSSSSRSGAGPATSSSGASSAASSASSASSAASSASSAASSASSAASTASSAASTAASAASSAASTATTAASQASEAAEAATSTVDKVSQAADEAISKAEETLAEAKSKVEEAAGKAQEAITKAKEKADEAIAKAEEVVDEAKETANKAVAAAKEGVAKAKEAAAQIPGPVGEAAQKAVAAAEEGVNKAEEGVKQASEAADKAIDEAKTQSEKATKAASAAVTEAESTANKAIEKGEETTKAVAEGKEEAKKAVDDADKAATAAKTTATKAGEAASAAVQGNNKAASAAAKEAEAASKEMSSSAQAAQGHAQAAAKAVPTA